MTLSNLIRKSGLAQIVTATPATLATHEVGNAASVAEVATVAVANLSQTPASTMSSEDETVIRAWLVHIGETDPVEITSVLHQCQQDEAARSYFTGRAVAELPKTEPLPVPAKSRCIECRHFQRTEHPYLGHCAVGESEAPAGLWATDSRICERSK